MAKAKKQARARRPARGVHDEGLITSQALRETIKAILKRVRVDRTWDIPYLAGYSRAGRIVYIDRHLPRTFRYRGRRIRVDPFMILHEAVEIALLDKLDLFYQDAHVVALLAERSAVEACGVAWRPYQRFMMKHVKRAGNKHLTRVPRRLNLTPYLDEQDLPLLHDMLPLMYRKWDK